MSFDSTRLVGATLAAILMLGGSALAQQNKDNLRAQEAKASETSTSKGKDARADKSSAAKTGDATAVRNEDTATWVDIATWDTTYLYDGWSATNLLDQEAYGENGNVVGEIEDFIIGPEGRIQKVVVEGGGFLDIGDTHLAIPWNRVTRVGSISITVPVTEETFGEFGMFENVDDMPPKPQNFRLTELLGDPVTVRDNIGYGHARDVIFDNEGKIEAVIVEPAYGYGYRHGPHALPYHGTYSPYLDPYYGTPYTVAQLKEVRPFNYGELDGG